MKRTIYFILFTALILQMGCYNVPIEIQSDDPKVQLKQRYSIYLDSSWTEKHVDKLYSTLESISPEPANIPSAWKISQEDLDNDIQTETINSLKYVIINRDVFRIDDVQSESESNKRFFFAIVEHITENGTNSTALKHILQERYGITVDIPSYALLLQHTTQESEADYSEFENEDLMIFISIFEEFPKALQKLPQLRYVIRRIDDKIRAPGMAWTSSGYIELSQAIFGRKNVDDTRRLIAHEKVHFLWAHLFTDQLKQDWIELGGWYRDDESKTGWSTNKNRKEFVTDYAYSENPNEDMAESLAYYLVYPEKLQAVSPAKYDFIHDRIIRTYSKIYIPTERM